VPAVPPTLNTVSPPPVEVTLVSPTVAKVVPIDTVVACVADKFDTVKTPSKSTPAVVETVSAPVAPSSDVTVKFLAAAAMLAIVLVCAAASTPCNTASILPAPPPVAVTAPMLIDVPSVKAKVAKSTVSAAARVVAPPASVIPSAAEVELADNRRSAAFVELDNEVVSKAVVVKRQASLLDKKLFLVMNICSFFLNY
jgi:hypothetical protein